jgi:hypothetical protein
MDAHRKTRGLTATNLATHHHLQCDLYLHYTYHGIQKHLGYNTHTSGAPSELAKAQFERGIGWETALYKWLDEEGLLLRLGPVVYTAADLGEMLDLDERGHFFVTGISIQPPNQAFTLTYQHYDPNIKPVTFGIAKPDLVEILRKEDGTCQWRVIDAKSSMQMKVRTSFLDYSVKVLSFSASRHPIMLRFTSIIYASSTFSPRSDIYPWKR